MKTKKHKRIIVITLAITMIAMYGFFPAPEKAEAVDQLDNLKDTISDSDFGASATHTIEMTTGSTTMATGFLSVKFHSAFTNVLQGNVTCGKNAYQQAIFTASSTAGSNIVDCIVGAGGLTATSTTITVTAVVNPTPSISTSYLFYVNEYYLPNVEQEAGTFRVVILSDVRMLAQVNAQLTFNVAGTSTGATVGNVLCDQDTTATTIDFGELSITASTTICQELTVATNATDGFVVTVEQDHELQNDSGDDINSFYNAPTGQGSSTAALAWDSPLGILDDYKTYGHMGLTSDDSDLNSLGGFIDLYNGGNNEYVGFYDTNPITIMHHNNPTNGWVQNESAVAVAYTTEVMSLQEAGDYELSLTYICTATY